MLNELRLSSEKYHDEGSTKAYENVLGLVKTIPIQKIYSYCFMILKADSLIEKKAENIILFLADKDIHIVDYKIKHLFYDREKESIYRYKLIDGINDWYVRKKIFEIGPSIGLLVSYEGNDYQTIFEKIDSIKGTSNALKAPNGTIRKEFHGNNMIMNLIHSSDDPIATFREAELFFDYKDIVNSLHKVHTYKESEVIFYSKYFAADMETDFDVLCNRLIHQLEYMIHNKIGCYINFNQAPRFDVKDTNVDSCNVIVKLDMIKELILKYLHENKIEDPDVIVNIGTAMDLINMTRKIFNYEDVNWEQIWRRYDENQIYFTKIQEIVIQGGFVCR